MILKYKECLAIDVHREAEQEEGLMNYTKRSDIIRVAWATAALTTPNVSTNHRI